MKIIKNNKYSELVNFKKNQKEPIHRWFNIKEGYSKELVLGLIDDLNIKDGFIVDFFNGSGTTSLASKEKSLNYFGFEVNPFLYLLSKVKLADYSTEEINNIVKQKKSILKKYKKNSIDNDIKLSIIQNVFRENLEDILRVRKEILKIKDTDLRDFFIIASTSILEDVGYAKKDGNGLKYPKNKKVINFIDRFSKQVDLMIDDIKIQNNLNQKKSKLILSDSRNIDRKHLDFLKDKASLVVFSPPYANCFDYSEVYKLELWLSGFVNDYPDLKIIRNSSLSSHLNKDLNEYGEHPLLTNEIKNIKKKNVWSEKIFKMINGYFYDMEKVLKNSFNVLKEGGYCVVIVGNSAYSGHIIETDVILSKIAKEIGFREVEINIARKLRASSQQSKLFKDGNALRESVIIIKK